MKLTFDRDKHEYRLDGRWIPGITAVLRGAGEIDDRMDHIPEEYRDRGTAVHSWIEAMMRGRIGARPVPPVVQPYLAGIRQFMADTRAEFIAAEDLVAHRAYRYATQVDIVVRWQGGVWAINAKTGNRYPHYPMQSALEALAWASWHNSAIPRRACLYVTKQGRHALDEHTDPAHLILARKYAMQSLEQLNQEERHDEAHRDHPGRRGCAEPSPAGSRGRAGAAAPRRIHHPARR